MNLSNTTTAHCNGCNQDRPVDRHWRALWIDSDGDFISTQPEAGCDLSYERPNTALACGQTCSLRLFERFLHTGSFDVEAPRFDADLFDDLALDQQFNPNL